MRSKQRVWLVLVALAVVATVATVAGGFAGRDARVSSAAGEGSATITIVAPDTAQPLDTPFQVRADLTSFTPGTSTTWAGYEFELAYDTTVLQVNTVTPGLCPASGWGFFSSNPHVVTGCAFQSSTATGVIETIDVTCLISGASQLTLVAGGAPMATSPGTVLFDENATDLTTTLTSGSVTCEGSSPSMRVGSAAIVISAPRAAPPLHAPFDVQANLTSFNQGTSTTWGGYDFELAYDPTVLQVTSSARGLCSASGWQSYATTPHVITGCAFQASTATGVLETVTFQCKVEGSSALTLLRRADPGAQATGTALFDETAVDFVMTLISGSVTCGGAPPPATPTRTSTVTVPNTGGGPVRGAPGTPYLLTVAVLTFAAAVAGAIARTLRRQAIVEDGRTPGGDRA